MKAILLTLFLASQAHAGIIMQRMSGEMMWEGFPPTGEREIYGYQADIYLTDDYQGGIVWLRSDSIDHAWTVNASSMHTADQWYLYGDDIELTLHGDFGNTKPEAIAAELRYWPRKHNPENLINSLRAEGRLWSLAPARVVPEPGRIVTYGAALVCGLILLAVRRENQEG